MMQAICTFVKPDIHKVSITSIKIGYDLVIARRIPRTEANELCGRVGVCFGWSGPVSAMVVGYLLPEFLFLGG